MRLTERCYAVTGLGYSAPWCVNAGFVTGDVWTLIVDAGGNTLAAQTVLGYARAARPANRLRAINTERHFDHIGGNGLLRSEGIDVWGHSGVERTADEFRAEIEEFNAAIPNAVRRARGEARAFFHETGAVNPNRAIERDTSFDLGDCTAEILLTPGHTPANLSVWLPADRVLYTGDCVVREYLPNLDAGGPAEWRQWLASLNRIAALGAEVLVPGHGSVARGAEVAASIESIRIVLREAIACGASPTGDGQAEH